MRFDVFYELDSFSLDAKAKKVIADQYRDLRNEMPATSKVTVEVTGWVQPTKTSPNIQRLSTGRAQAVVTYLRSLGLKASYTINAPGHDKRNTPSSRRASVVINWSNS